MWETTLFGAQVLVLLCKIAQCRDSMLHGLLQDSFMSLTPAFIKSMWQEALHVWDSLDAEVRSTLSKNYLVRGGQGVVGIEGNYEIPHASD